MKKQTPYFIVAFVFPITAMLWWWGLFATAEVTFAERGGYRYAYLEAEGAYSKLSEKQNEVRFYLKQQGITPQAEMTLVLTDPRTTPYAQLSARTGYMIDAHQTVSPPLKADTVPMRQVVVSKIKAHPLLAYGKTYDALLKFTQAHDISFHLPTLEIYNKSVLSVEMPIVQNEPIKKSP